MKWLPYPMLRIAVFFMGGIVLSIYFSSFISLRLAIVLILIFTVFYFIINRVVEKRNIPIVSGVIGLSIIFLLGYSRLQLQIDARKENHISKIKESFSGYEAIVRSAVQEKEKSWKVEVEIIRAKTNQWQEVTGNLLLYISKNEPIASNLKYGDKIFVKGNPQEITAPRNPHEFNFKAFLKTKNIAHQQFVKKSEVIFISSAERKGFVYYAHVARAWSLKIISKFITGLDEQAVASALIIGVTDAIDDDIISAYAASGTLHVLAVSGMHVGIIYAIILFLFKPFERNKNSKWFVAVISLVSLWLFAFITGLSPSVLRAVAMFSFFAAARPFNIRTNMYNTLAASALVLLIYNPYLIVSVGFQLSYLAVLGIVYLQQPIYRLWDVQSRVGDWVWKMTCVSIAAQLTTFALGLLYFHQFPTYFLLSNLFVIPLSTVVLVGGIFLLAIGYISPLASATGFILEGLIKVLNWIVFKIESFPFSLINDIQLSVFQCVLLFLILSGLILLFEFKNIRGLYFSIVMAILFSATQWIHFYKNIDTKQFISYSLNQHRAVEFLDRGHSYFLKDSTLALDRQQIRFHIQPNRLVHGIASVEEDIPFEKEINGVSYFKWNKKWIALIKKKEYQLPVNATLDVMLVSHQSLTKKSMDYLNTTPVIFDGSNSSYYVATVEKILHQKKIDTFYTTPSGAFIQ